ncbi:septal ring factor EnvC (AmiA/AmiB activator) [Ureibacillus xyleni]|uniref:Septal ring factor EnvC (AmiA/AmiB activator) n=1 Tax=Ureibacillus xyleni TaxID=614648 RepID=A0A285RBU4_9BACL|nr:peptidoglycan DD-metalloendopeptidase family protein [Ureibacillus xyleni]SOB91540.1 septal ring factor EnvC (AmiA/AmiB activator) [Ureibacillus xyleni]
MKSFNKKPFQIFLAIVAFFLAVQMPIAYATSLSDLKDQKSQVEQQKNQLNSQIKQKSNAISTIEGKQDALLAQISKLGKEITKTNDQISIVSGEIKEANNEIEKLQQEIVELQEKIDQRDELLQERARAIQANGSVSYIDVLLGANSFVDFIDRFSAVNTLMEADRQIMRDQKNDQEKLEEQKLMLEKTKKELETKQAKLQSLKESLNAQKVEKNKLVDELEAEQEKLASEKKLLEKEYSEALEVSKELQQKIIAEQNRILELSRQNQQGALPVVSSGDWTKPTNGTLTSGYGWRNLGYGPEFHYGIDLANSIGTPIVAAAGGAVVYAGPLSSYGNVVIVTHNMGGDIYTTVYAHLDSYSVSVGQTVGKGEQIARMGNTGRSTGPHLHFEVHIGTWQGQVPGNVNPIRYIPL